MYFTFSQNLAHRWSRTPTPCHTGGGRGWPLPLYTLTYPWTCRPIPIGGGWPGSAGSNTAKYVNTYIYIIIYTCIYIYIYPDLPYTYVYIHAKTCVYMMHILTLMHVMWQTQCQTYHLGMVHTNYSWRVWDSLGIGIGFTTLHPFQM